MKTDALKINPISFKAGLNGHIIREAQKTNVKKIAEDLGAKGIVANFNDDKVSAYCIHKVISLIEELNTKFKLKLGLPKGVFVEDFDTLNIDNKKLFGFCNLLPTKLRQNSNEIVPQQTIFLNIKNFRNGSIEENLSNLNAKADANYISKFSSGNNFLHMFLHETAHCIHEENLLKKYNGQTFYEKINSVSREENQRIYRQKYGEQVSQICSYALVDQLEATACALSRLIESSLGQNSLVPIKNIFSGSMIEDQTLLKRMCSIFTDYKNPSKNINHILNDFYNGKFEI